jgi:predicted permease
VTNRSPSALLRRVARLFGRERLDAQLQEEMRLHIELRARALVDEGMDPREAEYEAQRRFGNAVRIREDSRAMWGFSWTDTLAQDVRYGIRQLRRGPLFTAVAVLSLAVGIGTAAAVVTLADLVLFRKLPVRNPDELAIVRWVAGTVLPFESLNGYGSQNESESSSTSFSLAAYEAVRDEAADTASVVGFADMYRVNLGIGGSAELANGHAVSGTFFDVLGVAPVAGRPIGPADDQRAAAPVAMLSHGFWQRRFGGAADAIGRSITINGLAATIVGVAPPGFNGALQVGSAPSVFVPLTSLAQFERTEDHFDPNHWWVLMLARLRPGVTADAARPTLEAIVRRTVAAHQPALDATHLPRLVLDPGARGQLESRNGTREPLLIMTAVVAIVLLVACANIATLLLARARARTREIAVRLSLGAGRGRIVQQIMTECLLLALLAGTVAAAVVVPLAQLLLPALEQGDPILLDVAIDARTIAITFSLAVLTTLVFGWFPALRSTAPRVAASLRETERGTPGRSRGVSATGGLVAAQIALSLVLASGAGLLTATVRNLDRIDPGFDPSNLLLFRIDPTLNGYSGERLRALYAGLLEGIRSVPGVASATLSSHTLIADSASIHDVFLPGDPPPTEGPGAPAGRLRPLTWRQTIDAAYFRTMNIPVLSGRTFGVGDAMAAQRVAIVNATFVRRILGGAEPIGQRILLGRRQGAPEYEIVGVVGDARFSRLRDEVPPTIYVSYRQHQPGAMTFAARTGVDPLTVVDAVRRAIAEADADVPMFDVRTQEAQIAHSLRRERLFAQLAGLLSMVTMALCGIGVYGLLAQWVTRRTPEIGVRMALGATRANVRWLVLRQSLVLVACGITIGIPAAVGTLRLLQNVLYGLDPSNPLALSAAAAILSCVAAVAAYLPARRATRVDPMVALREL